MSLHTRIVITVESDREFSSKEGYHEVVAERIAASTRRHVEDLVGSWAGVKGVTHHVTVADRRP